MNINWKEIRYDLRMTQKELARILDIPLQTYISWENEVRKMPKAKEPYYTQKIKGIKVKKSIALYDTIQEDSANMVSEPESTYGLDYQSEYKMALVKLEAKALGHSKFAMTEVYLSDLCEAVNNTLK